MPTPNPAPIATASASASASSSRVFEVAGFRFEADDLGLVIALVGVALASAIIIGLMRRIDARWTARAGRAPDQTFFDSTVLGEVLLHLNPLLVALAFSFSFRQMGIFGRWWWMAAGFCATIGHLLFKSRLFWHRLAARAFGAVLRRFGIELDLSETDDSPAGAVTVTTTPPATESPTKAPGSASDAKP